MVAGIGPSSAQASAELTPSDDDPTDYWFEYGPTTGYGSADAGRDHRGGR